MSMAAFGALASKQGLLPPEVSRGLAALFMNILLPCLLFASIIDCNQDWSTNPCPDIRTSVAMGWPLLFLPVVNTLVGGLLGMLVNTIARPPPEQRSLVVTAVTFGNATGLPIALLLLIRSQFPENSELGVHNPLLFLSVYLLTYPIIQESVYPLHLLPRLGLL
jgi:predicted permease